MAFMLSEHCSWKMWLRWVLLPVISSFQRLFEFPRLKLVSSTCSTLPVDWHLPKMLSRKELLAIIVYFACKFYSDCFRSRSSNLFGASQYCTRCNQATTSTYRRASARTEGVVHALWRKHFCGPGQKLDRYQSCEAFSLHFEFNAGSRIIYRKCRWLPKNDLCCWCIQQEPVLLDHLPAAESFDNCI